MASQAERIAAIEAALVTTNEAIASLSTLIAASLTAPVRGTASSPVAVEKAVTYDPKGLLPCTASPRCGKTFKSASRAASHNTPTGHYAPKA